MFFEAGQNITRKWQAISHKIQKQAEVLGGDASQKWQGLSQRVLKYHVAATDNVALEENRATGEGANPGGSLTYLKEVHL